MDKKKATKIQNINDGISAGSGIVALAVPEFSVVPLIVFGVNRILGFVSDDDIIKRLKKIEKQLQNKKISKSDFKDKISKLSEHKKYFSTGTLENIIKNCIPETVDIYISLFIDYIMREECDIEEELCEILSSLNKHDLELLKMIKDYLDYGGKINYYREIKRLDDIKKRNKEIELENIKIEEENKKIQSEPSKGFHKISLITTPKIYDRSVVIDEQTTIFWQDFSNFCKLPVQTPLNYTMFYRCYENLYKEGYDNWIFYGKSFIKLEKNGVLQLDCRETPGTLNVLNISRFHITILGRELLKYIDKEYKNM